MKDLSNYSLLVICFIVIVIFGYKYLIMTDKLSKQIVINKKLKIILNVRSEEYKKLQIEYNQLKNLLKTKHINTDEKWSTKFIIAKNEIEILNKQLMLYKLTIFNNSKKKEREDIDYLNAISKYKDSINLLADYNIKYKLLIEKINNLKEFSSKSNLDYEKVIIKFENQSEYIANIIDIYTPFINNYDSLLRKLMTVKDPELNSFFRKLILEFKQKRMEN